MKQIISGRTAYAENRGSDIFLFSYNTIVSGIDEHGNKFIYKKYYKFSPTTSKHIGKFFKLTYKQINEKIQTGEILLI